MKQLLLVFMLFLSTFVCFAEDINYKYYDGIVNTEIKNQKKVISTIKSAISKDKNNVELHKKLVYANTKLDELKVKKRSIKDAVKYNKKLIKENNKLDKQKTKLLNIKRTSEDYNNKMIELFK